MIGPFLILKCSVGRLVRHWIANSGRLVRFQHRTQNDGNFNKNLTLKIFIIEKLCLYLQ